MAFMGRGESGRGVPLREKNNYHQGRTGSATKTKPGVVKGVRHNPTSGGGINRPTKGIGKGASSY